MHVTKAAAWWLTGVVAVATIQGCGGPARYTRTVNEAPGHYVRLEARYGQGEGYGYDGAAMRFAHPVSLSEEGWAKILEGIRVKPRKQLLSSGSSEIGPTEAFREEDRRYLARHLSEAFAKARPDEWVVFYLSHQRDEQGEYRGGSRITEVTSGGLFVEGARLRLVLANYRYAVSTAFMEEQIRDEPLRPAGEGFYELVPGRSQAVRWVDTINAGWDMSKPLRAQLLEMTIEYQAMLAPPAATGDQFNAPEPGETPPLEERLRTLQRLREQGLITEEEYRLKRQKLLDKL